ncbi:MAG: flagellar basal body P-ring protein FlgI [Phycisphaerae bacterium]|nr:flagellar basal body P-ring protein FlgI [Phycisphaerae bacterium]
MRLRFSSLVSVSVFLMLSSAACELFDPNQWKATDGTSVEPAKPEPVLAYSDAGDAAGQGVWAADTGTVASVAYLRGNQNMAVGGYGLVIGLDGGGSSTCPQSVAEYLRKEIRRTQLGASPTVSHAISPDDLIKSPHTAAVMVMGEIPAAALKGRRFDVFVRAVDQDVKSLAGGTLLPCDLRLLSTGMRPDPEGRLLGRAAGRVFTNPFSRDGDTTSDSDPREGRVLGGGCSTNEDRRVALNPVSPSYSIVREVARSINNRFGPTHKSADPLSPSSVKLSVPPQYEGRESEFLELATHIPLATGREMIELRAKALSDDLARPEAPYERTSLCLEAIGPSAIPFVRKHYTHRQRATSYFAARVGGRLGDDLAIEVLRQHAEERDGSYRQPAIEELGRIEVAPAMVTSALRGLLEDDDPRIRIAAYESLRRRDDPVVQSYRVGEENFVLDVVASKGSGLIYARRTGERRIVLIGSSIRCRPPLFYSGTDRPVTLSANGDAEKITLVRRFDDGRRISDPVQVSLDVSELVRVLGADLAPGGSGGLGADYGLVLDILSEFCQSGAILAQFRLEQTSVTDLLGPIEPMVRPETDEL